MKPGDLFQEFRVSYTLCTQRNPGLRASEAIESAINNLQERFRFYPAPLTAPDAVMEAIRILDFPKYRGNLDVPVPREVLESLLGCIARKSTP